MNPDPLDRLFARFGDGIAFLSAAFLGALLALGLVAWWINR